MPVFLASLSAPSLTHAEVEQTVYTIHGSGTTNPSKCFWHIMSLFEQRSHVMTRLTYRAVGSSTGQHDFLGKATENPYKSFTNTFGAGDIPIKTDDYNVLATESGADAMVHLPFAISSVSFFVNIPGVGTDKDGLRLNACTAARIYNGKITTWNDPEIVALNRKLENELNEAAQEDAKIYVGRRVKGSSSTASVAKFFNKACPDEWGTDKVKSTLTDEQWGSHTKKCYGSSQMTKCIRDNKGSIGYLDSGHGWSEGLLEVDIENKSGYFLTSRSAHNFGGIQKAVEDVTTPGSTENWGEVDFIYQSGEYTWPLVVMSYVYVRTNVIDVLEDSKNRGLFKLFLEALYDDNYFGKCKKLGFTSPPTDVADEAKRAIDEEILWQFPLNGDGERVDEWSFEKSETLKATGMGKYVISDKRKSLAGVSIDEIAGVETQLEKDVKSLEKEFRELIEGVHKDFNQNNLGGNEFENTLDDHADQIQAALVLSALSFTLWLCAIVGLFVKKCILRM